MNGRLNGGNVGGVIDAMKSQPLSLALVIMNVALLVLMYFIVVRNADLREKEFHLVFQNQERMMALVGRCADGK
jgi:hypothetical protein